MGAGDGGNTGSDRDRAAVLTVQRAVARIRAVHRLTASLIVLCALLCGCPTSTNCPRVGEACSFTCCLSDGLQCRAGDNGGYCTKTCHCKGTSICTPSNFIDGCPQGS